MPLAPDVALERFAERTEGYTGDDLYDLIRRAGLLALRESRKAQRVTGEHFERALKDSRPSVTPEVQREYEVMARDLKRDAPRRMAIRFLPIQPT